MASLYDKGDSAAVELHWDPSVAWDLRGLVEDARSIGASRVAVRGDAADYARMPPGLLEMPRVALVIRHSDAVVVRSHNKRSRLLRQITPLALAEHLQGLSSIEGYIDPVRWIFDLSAQLCDLSSLSLGGEFTLSLWDNVVSSTMLHSHPCFAYACLASDCHLNRTLPPRRVTITRAGDVIPYQLDAGLFGLGNVTSQKLSDILQQYANTDAGRRFRVVAQRFVAAVATDYRFLAPMHF